MLNDIQRPTQHRDIGWYDDICKTHIYTYIYYIYIYCVCIIVYYYVFFMYRNMCIHIYMQHTCACDVYTVIFTPNIIWIRVSSDSQRRPVAWRSSKFPKVYHETKIEDSAFHVLHPFHVPIINPVHKKIVERLRTWLFHEVWWSCAPWALADAVVGGAWCRIWVWVKISGPYRMGAQIEMYMITLITVYV